MATARKKGLPLRHIHITRMTPKRDEEFLAGGSLYWVIKGEIAAREKIIALEPFRDKDGIGRCRLVMQPKVIAVSPRPMRPFQGWRYLAEDDAPPDLGKSSAGQRSRDAGADAARIARSGAALTEFRPYTPILSIRRVVPSFAATRIRTGPPLPRRSAPASRRGGLRNNPARSRRRRSFAAFGHRGRQFVAGRSRLALSFMAR